MFEKLKTLTCNAEIQANYLAFPRLQGVIVAIAVLPIEVEVEEWFPLLSKRKSKSDVGEVSFSNETLASEFAITLTHCIQGVAKQIEDQAALSLFLPNEGDLSQFAEAFFDITYQYHEQWDAFIGNTDEETAGLFQTTQLLICKLAKIMADEPAQQALFEQLPCEDEIVKVLPTLLSVLGNRSKLL